MKTLGRRVLLRGGGIALGLPFLEAMLPPGRALAQAKARRFLTFWTPNGNVMSAWNPTGTETDFKLGRVLAPLEPHKKDLIVLQGVDTMTASPAPCGHYPAVIAALTGQPTPAGNVFMGQGWSPGISLDQHIGSKITATRLKTLELGVGIPKLKSGMDTLSYTGPNKPVPVQCNPADVFQRMFGDAVTGASTGDAAAAARLRAENKTVLDAVLGQFSALRARLGAEDQRRLEAHAQQVREIELRLTSFSAASAPPAACQKGTAPMSITPTGNFPLFPMAGKLQMDLAALAFSCDLTRVTTLMWAIGTSGQTFPFAGVNDAHHPLSHNRDGASIEKLTKVNVWYMEQLAYLIGKLKAMPDAAGGSVFESAVIYSSNELTDGAAHSHNDSPLLLAGSAGGYFKTGRYLRYSGNVPHNNVLVSIMNAMGIPETTFGKKEWCTGPLARLTG